MKTSKVVPEDLSASVVAVPPLARNRDLGLDRQQNLKLIRHLEAGGVTTLMYGGNANFYNVALSEYAEILAFLAEAAAPESWVIPSVGPDYGKMMDQAAVLKDTDFPTVMVLPMAFPATPAGIETGIRRFTDRLGKPVVFYIKADGYVTPDGFGRMVDDGLICAAKYAVVREDPGRDDYLGRLLERIDRRHVLSGIGERPAVAHMRTFDLPGFTSGSVCVAPNLSRRMLEALRAEDFAGAEAIRERFLPLEDLRDAIHPVRVLHAAVTLAGIAEMGPLLPMLHGLDGADEARVREAAIRLLAADRATDAAAA